MYQPPLASLREVAPPFQGGEIYKSTNKTQNPLIKKVLLKWLGENEIIVPLYLPPAYTCS